ncbi:unnamed protein product [Lupinus luteus]|uniref:Pollen Ole e 1 allergen and extensin family protein n=1 Tax=Lupinus luteus TaxID=3873 RepID=A0AAV1VVK1_LUPLU
MAKAQALFIVLVSFSLCVFSLELGTALPHSPPLSAHALPHHRHHQSPLHHSLAHPPHQRRYHHRHHSYAPSNSPTHNHRRTPAPTKPHTNHIYTNILTLAKPPTRHMSTRFVAVEGRVLTKSCNRPGGDPIKGGVTVKLECNNRSILVKTTNFNGYFYILADKSITADKSRNCKVYLVSAPNGLKLTDLNGGIRGATLIPQFRIVPWNHLYYVFKVGDFVVESICKH